MDARTLVGIPEIAQALEVAPATVSIWRQRGIFPKPAAIVSDRPAWRLETVLGWAEATGRLGRSHVPTPGPSPDTRPATR